MLRLPQAWTRTTALALQRQNRLPRVAALSVQLMSTQAAAEAQVPVATRIEQLLESELKPEYLRVRDTSGGCGEFVAIEVSCPAFENMTALKREKMVHNVISQQIKGMHGLTVRTITPSTLAKLKADHAAQCSDPTHKH